MEKLTPDDKPICNFRKDNAEALKRVFRTFSAWCNEQGLFGNELVAVDGTKIRANSSWKNIYTLSGAKTGLEKIDEKINRYMKELETNDALEPSKHNPDSEAIILALERLNEKKTQLNNWLAILEQGEITEISTVDPDARIMRQGGDGRAQDACYNVRTVVDSKHKLIVDFENSTCANDIGALAKPMEGAKEIMGVTEIAVVADTGFYDGADIKKCEDNGSVCYIAKRERRTRSPLPEYGKQYFSYDKAKDCYSCPQGTELRFMRFSRNKEWTSKIYGNPKDCRECLFRKDCTTNKRGYREIRRVPNQDTLDAVDVRMATATGREFMSERRKIVEHPYGTVKKIWGYGSFLCRGLEKTTAEVSLTFLAYNLCRVYNICIADGKNILKILA